MKLQLFLLVGAACALTGGAGAQSADEKTGGGSLDLRGQEPVRKDDQRSGVQLRDIPSFGGLFYGKSAPVRPRLLLPPRDENLLFGPQFPPVPKLDMMRAGTRIRVLKVAGDEILQVEIVRQSLGEVLRKLTAVMGVRTVIDPNLDKQQVATKVVRGRDFDELFAALSQVVETVKSPAGTYFFALKPASENPEVFLLMPDGSYQRFDILPRLRVKPGAPAQNGPFSFGPSENYGIDPDFVMPKGGLTLPPQPNWEKREFNGREFYFMPAPIQ